MRRRLTCCGCPARHSLFWHETPSFVSLTTGNADISYYPSPLSVFDGKRGPPGAHYRSCQMIGAARRSRGTPNTWSRLPQDVSGRWHGYPLLAWVSFLKEREKGACVERERERGEKRREPSTAQKKLQIQRRHLRKMRTAFWQKVNIPVSDLGFMGNDYFITEFGFSKAVTLPLHNNLLLFLWERHSHKAINWTQGAGGAPFP